MIVAVRISKRLRLILKNKKKKLTNRRLTKFLASTWIQGMDSVNLVKTKGTSISRKVPGGKV